MLINLDLDDYGEDTPFLEKKELALLLALEENRLDMESHKELVGAIRSTRGYLNSLFNPHHYDGHGGLLDFFSEILHQEGFGVVRGIPDQLPSNTAQRLVKRDGWECYYCGVPLGWGHPCVKAPEVEHRIPKSRGGSNKLDNLVLSCATCNSRKGTKTEEEYREFLAVKAIES